jgi:hypothetical protein
MCLAGKTLHSIAEISTSSLPLGVPVVLEVLFEVEA